jgi:SAM-dependent methyltransferase
MQVIAVTAVDLSSTQIERARKWWGHIPELTLIHGELVEYLTHTDQAFDAMYSTWGGVWFTDPALLMPAVLERLAPGGVLAFSQAQPVEGCYGRQGMYAQGFRGGRLPVHRWSYTPDMWRCILRQAGFLEVEARIVPAPVPTDVGTLVVQAWKAP